MGLGILVIAQLQKRTTPELGASLEFFCLITKLKMKLLSFLFWGKSSISMQLIISPSEGAVSGNGNHFVSWDSSTVAKSCTS